MDTVMNNFPDNESQPVAERPGRSAIFMVLSIQNNTQSIEQVRNFCNHFSALVRSINIRDPNNSFLAVMGFGSEAWGKLFGNPRPAKLHPFAEIQGSKHTAPATPGDLLFHLRADSVDICFEFARLVMEQLDGAVQAEDEVHGFRYFDGRTVIGFVDGTENPTGEEAVHFAVIGEEDPQFSGGSYVIVQKYLHNMNAWNALPVEMQEHAIGRRKFDDVELDEATKPANAHNAVTNITDENGNELKIVRCNLPFGNPASSEFGTYFIGYARDPGITEKMLHNMFIGEPPGNHDRLLDFSTAVTGSLFFIPSATLLDELAQLPLATEEVTPVRTEQTDDGSLKIGSLKQEPQKLYPINNH